MFKTLGPVVSGLEIRPAATITLDVAVDLAIPKFDVRCRPASLCARVSVPKAAMHEYCDPKSRQNDIRFARQAGHMQPKAISCSEQLFAYVQFRRRIPTADRGHHSGTLLAADAVRHRLCRRYEAAQRRQCGLETDLLFRPRERDAAHEFVVFLGPQIVLAQAFEHRREALARIGGRVAAAASGVGPRGVEQQRFEGRRVGDPAFERGEIVQIADDRRIVLGGAELARADPPRERAQLDIGVYGSADP
jgi:hypothetical protein